MIRITKDISVNQTPTSLRPPFGVSFAPKKISGPARKTSERRNRIIRNGAYLDTKANNSRYKTKDIKGKLKDIYKNKCAFCEQRLEQFHVEHYRPKQKYCWLTYSWDNLISACPTCNTFKGTHFRINGAKASFSVNFDSIRRINTLSAGYDAIENPDLVNPEVTDPSGMLTFNVDGSVTSADPRFQYTIDICRIDRDNLRDLRKKILDDFKRDLRVAFVSNLSKNDQTVAIETIVKKFLNDFADSRNDFLAFREYVIKNRLSEEIKDAKN